MSITSKAVTRMVLDMGKVDVQKSVAFTKGDVNRRWEVTLVDNGSPFDIPRNWTVALSAIKPDGNPIYNGCVVEHGRIVYDFASGVQLVTSEGIFAAEFDVFDETGQPVCSPRVWIQVLPVSRNLAPMESDPQFTLLRQFLERAGDLEADIGEIREEIADIVMIGKAVVAQSAWRGSPLSAVLAIPELPRNSATLLYPADKVTRAVVAHSEITAWVEDVEGHDPVITLEAASTPSGTLTFIYAIIRSERTGRPLSVAAIMGVGGGDSEPGSLQYVSDGKGRVTVLGKMVETVDATARNQVAALREEFEQDQEIPTFDLAGLGLPTIQINGKAVELETDTTEIIAALAEGAVRFKVRAEYNGLTFSNFIITVHDLSGGICSYAFELYEIPLMLSIAITKGKIQATGLVLAKKGGESAYIGTTPPKEGAYNLWVDTSANPALIKYRNEKGMWSTAAGSGGNGGSGGSTYGDFAVTNESGWLAKTVAFGGPCIINLSWSSKVDGISTGNGTMKISSNGVVKATQEVAQGSVTPDVGKYLNTGANDIEITISDAYGNSRTLKYSIEAVSVSISSYFDDSIAYTGNIPFSYTPLGEVEKTVHFLVDGKSVGTQTVTASNREQPYTIPAQAHGSHTLEVYFTATIDTYPVESNHLYYDLICYEEGNTTPIITTSFRGTSFKQYATVVIPYIVYTPGALTSAIQLKDGTKVVANLTVDRTRQTWAYKATEAGAKSLSIVCGSVVKPVSFSVTESEIDVQAETASLELYLTSEGRSNNEEAPLEWGYGGVSAELTGFNLKADGWQSDENGDTVLRVTGDARVSIPFNIFGSDFRTTGKTIEIEFATRSVMNYDAVVLSCWSGERGIKVTAQKALLKSEQSEVFTQYKEDEHIRVAFCVEKRAENRLLAIYINGIMSGVVQYPDDDDFTQAAPVGISIGSSDCTVDIYCIRVYGNNLSRYQIVDNWIADTQDVDTMIDRYTRNDVFDAYGNIAVAKLPQDLPYMVVNAAKYEDLPQTETDEKTVSGFYKDPLHPERSFTFENAIMEIQGTSSLTYPRKNYRFKFKGGLVVNGKLEYDYKLRQTSYPTDVFTFKADHASSEGANNVELAMLYNETCPVKTPPQLVDTRVRQGIEGYPCVMFYYDGTNYHFIGKYNFNNDKSTAEVFGFKTGDESWEIRTNNTDMALWKDDNFAGNAWENTFEARYPKNSKNVTNLQALATWLKSTDTTAVDTEEEKAARLQKFKDEFENWFHKDAMIYNYIFTEMFLLMDNRAKNAFPTRYTEKDANGDDTSKWLILPYDYDSAIGINNLGQLTYGYHLEDTDIVGGHPVFNGQNSVLFVNIRLAFEEEIKTTYQSLRNDPAFAYKAIEKRFEDHQSVWGESIFNEDARFKYIEPLIEYGDEDQLPRLQGSKEEQRKWWLYNRFRYLDSKYEAGDSLKDYIKIRTYDVADINVTPYADIYAAARFNDDVVKVRALRAKDEEGNDVHYTLQNPMSNGQEADVLIYSASQLSDVGDLSGLKALEANFSSATRLSRLKIGSSAAGYDNPNLKKLSVGNLTLLKDIDVRNCSALAQSVDLSGCTNIERAYFEGTAITGVNLPNGGILKTLHLPGTVTSLSIMNQKQLTDFSLPSYANISTLRLEGISNTVVNSLEILRGMPSNARVRLIGIDWTVGSVEDIYTIYDKLDACRGMDENGNNTEKAVVSGTIHVDMVSQSDLVEFARRYPNVQIEYERIGGLVQFVNGDTVVYRQVLESGVKITPPSVTPTKESTAQYDFTFRGWSIDGVNVVNFGTMGKEDITYYALYYEVARKYTVRFLNGTTVLQTIEVAYGEVPVYTGSEPTSNDGKGFGGWIPNLAPVTGNADYVAKFVAQAVTRALLKRTITEYANENLTAVGDYAFERCTALTSVDIPNVTSIGAHGFWYCKELRSVRLPATPPTIESSTFVDINSACVFYIPSGTLQAYQANSSWSGYVTNYSFIEEDR